MRPARWTSPPSTIDELHERICAPYADQGRFADLRGTAPDRVISTVDPEARHGHKTAAHGFDGYQAHIAVDPDSEVICAAEVSPATTADAAVAPALLDDLTPG
jgi:hypothetical protein